MRRAPELTSFVGRQRELSDLARLLDESRLVTLAGPGGVGKSRLAARVLGDRDDVLVLDLAPIADPGRVTLTLVEQLGLPDPRALDDALAASTMLLVLDNCEHLLEACAGLATRLLTRCPNLRLLAATREPLHVAGESVLRLGPLDIPSGDSLGDLQAAGAAQLFVQRAQAARSDFRLTAANAEPIGRICRRLDGLPLAIELAANRVAAFAPVDIANRLDSLLSSASLGAIGRQQTLEATLAWSYDLLEPEERVLFDHLSVFVGGFTLGGAEAIHQPPANAPEILSRLVAKSLVLAEPQADGAVRYRLLEPLRAFGLANLTASGTQRDARQRHADYILALAERAQPELFRPDQANWFRQLEAEWDNIRQADDWLFEAADAERVLRLGAALAWWWARPDRQAEAYTRFARSLTLPEADQYRLARGRVVAGAAMCALQQSDMTTAERLSADALEVARAEGDTWVECMMLCIQGNQHTYEGDLVAADDLLGQAFARARATRERWVEVRVLDYWGDVALLQGDSDLAEERARASLRLARDGLDAWSRGMALISLGDLLRSRAESEAAGAAYEEALALLRPLDPRGLATHGLVHNLAYVALDRGQLQRAAERFVESADQYRRVGSDRRGLAECLIGLANVALREDRPELAARLLASADTALDELGSKVTASNRAAHQALIASVESTLDPARLALARSLGQRLSLAEALEQGRVLAQPTAGAAPTATLTPREVEVARLVASGVSNRQVADTLVISEKTAKNHVQRVLDKLGLRSRSQLAARRDELGLGD